MQIITTKPEIKSLITTTADSDDVRPDSGEAVVRAPSVYKPEIKGFTQVL